MKKTHAYYCLSLILATPVWASHEMRVRLESDIQDDLLKVIQKAPVHESILTTVFWVGERSRTAGGHSDNIDSAWDANWKENFGGLDSPIYRKGYFPAKFRPKQNPFYVALPFNDIKNPDLIETCPLLQFFKVKREQWVRSVCKNRWIEISYHGKTCYAQWQDVGPQVTNDYEYVFEGQEPKVQHNDMAGLDVSPAVRDYIFLKGGAHTTWRFVDDSEVPAGPWSEVVTKS